MLELKSIHDRHLLTYFRLAKTFLGRAARKEEDSQGPRKEENHIYEAICECYNDRREEEGGFDDSYYHFLLYLSIFSKECPSTWTASTTLFASGRNQNERRAFVRELSKQTANGKMQRVEG